MNDYQNLKFIHGIYLTDILKCKNLKETGMLNSMFFNSIFLSQVTVDYNTVSLEELKANADEVFKGLINPRAGLLYEASIIEKHPVVSVGIHKKILTDAHKDSILKRRDAELAFEKARRELAHLPPSRLTCLFIAEDDDDYHSRLNIAGMLTRSEWRPYIFKVSIIDCLEIHRADFRWYNQYLEKPDTAYIANYWSGEPYDETPGWEYLLEGRIGLTEEEEMTYLLANGTFELPEPGPVT